MVFNKLKFFSYLFFFIFLLFPSVKAESIINNNSGGPLFLFLVDKDCKPEEEMMKKLLFNMPTSPDFYFSLTCNKLGKTLELEPKKKVSIKEFNEFIVIGKLKSPVSKVSFCYLKNESELNIKALGIGGVTCECVSKENCNDKLY